MQKLIIIGAGGHGREVLWTARCLNRLSPKFEILGFCDDGLPRGMDVLGAPVLGTIEETAGHFGRDIGYVCAVGKNRIRPALVARADAAGWQPVTLIHPSAVVAEPVEIGAGVFIAAGAYVGPLAKIGDHALVNVHASVGHDSVLGVHVQVCPGAKISGGAKLGDGVFLGSNSVVAPGKTMGAWSKLSACSFAATDILAEALATGVPARPMLFKKPSE